MSRLVKPGPMLDRCYWAMGEDGFSILIPGCWNRVHDPDAACTCGEWDEDTARETIRGLERHVYAVRHENEKLRAILRRAGIPDPTRQYDWKAENARQRRRRMHLSINGEDCG
ncbi:hypothetical protein SAMN05421774_10843 [Gemmobacter megaterium]|uniref:Uncharacterized protein n=1 Tax=Gemmobacter megaterium TaxID=1086013 RepID=A0A1N7QAH9_9RHOB|nr:hypothetical protein [Gemmobacter megaterium]SIT19851.1 hypothetical protein SAMN05421774_10843 [Gemmobacter megaterium]